MPIIKTGGSELASLLGLLNAEWAVIIHAPTWVGDGDRNTVTVVRLDGSGEVNQVTQSCPGSEDAARQTVARILQMYAGNTTLGRAVSCALLQMEGRYLWIASRTENPGVDPRASGAFLWR